MPAYLEKGGVPARQSAYADPALAETYKFIPALVESWQDGVPEFRPRFAEWPAITEIVQEWGTKMMLGEVSIEEGAKHHRREDGSRSGRSRLLRRQEAAGAVTSPEPVPDPARRTPFAPAFPGRASFPHGNGRKPDDTRVPQHACRLSGPGGLALAGVGIVPLLLRGLEKPALLQPDQAGAATLRRAGQLRHRADRPGVLAGDGRTATLFLISVPVQIASA
jgi:hypothetical protein